MAVEAPNETGCDVLVQSYEASTCRGFRGIGVGRPVRLLVRAAPGAEWEARALADALEAAVRSLGQEVPAIPCRGSLNDPCMAHGEPSTLNVLVWVGSGSPADVDAALPLRLRDRQVVCWTGALEAVALDVLEAAQVVAAGRAVFVSYSHADGVDLANAVFRALVAARFSVSLDAFALAPGAVFAERIEHRLLDAAFLVLIETPAALASTWALRELAFARRHRLGLAAVTEEGPDRFPGIGRARRWTLPGSLTTAPGGGPALAAPAADDLRTFVSQQHARALARRSRTLDRGLRAALATVGVAGNDVRQMAGGLDVDAGGTRWAVSLRPRPASLVDMHAAARRTPAGSRGVMVSATPAGRPEREALGWLAAETQLPHWHEGRLLSLARGLAGGAL